MAKDEIGINAINAINIWVDNHKESLLELLFALIRIPSENRPPNGNEKPVQLFLDNHLQAVGFQTELYSLGSVTGLEGHDLFWPGRDYTERPNLLASKRGTGGGRSLLFGVHADVVPGIAGKHAPFEPVLKDGAVYGRGSNDMKGGIAAIITALQFVHEHGIELKGDVWFESVVDEEMGGANGTLAGRLRHDQADAVIIPEPTNLIVCPAHLGGVTWRITIKGKGGMGFGGEGLVNPVYAMARVVNEIERYHDEYKSKIAHQYASGDVLTPNVVISYMKAGDFEPGMADGIPSACTIEVWVESVPGESLDELERTFKQRINDLLEKGTSGDTELVWEQITRFLPGSSTSTEISPLLAQIVSEQCGLPEQLGMAPFACDAFMFNLYSPSPAIILGPSGENAHAADELVTVESLLQLTRIYIHTMLAWCNKEPLDD